MAKKFPAVRFLCLSRGEGKAELELFPCSQRAGMREEKAKDGGGEGSGPQRPQTVMHFRLKPDHGQLEEKWLTW